MNPPFEVLIDRDDDIATVRELHQLARAERGLCVAAVAPDSRLSVTVRWAILRALGKRSQQLRTVPQWLDVTRWLSAHAITELVLLQAQHLSDVVLDEVAQEVAGRLGVRVVLVFSGTSHAGAGMHPSIGLATLITRARPSARPERHRQAWPAVPRVHPLRLRHDARAKLSPGEFQDVQQLLAAACLAMSTWLLHHADATSSQIAAAHALISTGLDENHAFVRRCGADIALLAAGARVDPGAGLAAKPRQISTREVASLHEFTDPRAAALNLARQLTGLTDDLIALIAGDQVGDDRILGYQVPCAAFPILRAVDRGFGPVFDVRTDTSQVNSYTAQAPATNSAAAATLAWLLESSRHAVRISDVDDEARAELDGLGHQGLIACYDDAYRASDVALYGAFRRAAPTPRTY